MELIGKTISGVIAVPAGNGATRNRIWMLQFTDGTHVEFVSPNARNKLSRLSGRSRCSSSGLEPSPQLSLEVA